MNTTSRKYAVFAMTVAQFVALHKLSSQVRNDLVENAHLAKNPKWSRYEKRTHKKLRSLAETVTMGEALQKPLVHSRNYHTWEPRSKLSAALLAEGLTRFGSVSQEVAVSDTNDLIAAKALYAACAKALENANTAVAVAYRRIVAGTTTVDQARSLYEGSPRIKGARMAALERWVELCSTADELAEAYKTSSDFVGNSWSETNPAMEKWASVSRTEANTASTIEEAMEAFRGAPCESSHPDERDVIVLALLKWMSLCPTEEALHEVPRIATELRNCHELQHIGLSRIYNEELERLERQNEWH